MNVKDILETATYAVGLVGFAYTGFVYVKKHFIRFIDSRRDSISSEDIEETINADGSTHRRERRKFK